MKSKTLIVLFAICCVLTGITYLTMNQDKASDTQTKMGEKLLPDFPVNDVAKITIEDHENTVVLKKGEPVWVVESKFSYPADFSKLTDFVKKFNEVKIGRSFKADDAKLARLTLHRPDKEGIPEDQKGTHVILEDKAQKVLADIMLGKARDVSAGSGGHYMMLEKDPDIYLVDQSFRFLDTEAGEWIDKELLDVKADDIQEVRCMDPESGDAVYTLKKPEKGKDPELTNVPEGRKAKKSKVDNMFRALASLRTEDVADPAITGEETGVADARYFEFRLFDGTVYKAYPGKPLADDSEKFYFKADVSYVAPEAEPEAGKAEKAETEEAAEESSEPAESPEAEEDQKSEAELSAAAEEVNKRVSPWTYVIPKWKHEKFVTDVEGLLEEKKEDDKTTADTPPETGDSGADADNQAPRIGTQADETENTDTKPASENQESSSANEGDSEAEGTESPAEESESKLEGRLKSHSFLLAQADTSETEPEDEYEYEYDADVPEEPEPDMQPDESDTTEIPEEETEYQEEADQDAEFDGQDAELENPEPEEEYEYEDADAEGEYQEEDMPESEVRETE